MATVEHLERMEEASLLFVAFLFVRILVSRSIENTLVAMMLIALALIVVLVLRSVGWHRDRITPYDWVLIAGVFLTLAYLSAFLALLRSWLGAIVLLLFAGFYIIMAVLLAMHRGWLFGGGDGGRVGYRQEHRRRRVASASTRTDDARTADHKAPSKRRRFFLFRRKHDEEFKRGLEPIPEMQGPVLGKNHDSAFKRGMEPIHEVTAEHLHNLGVYDTETDAGPGRGVGAKRR